MCASICEENASFQRLHLTSKLNERQKKTATSKHNTMKSCIHTYISRYGMCFWYFVLTTVKCFPSEAHWIRNGRNSCQCMCVLCMYVAVNVVYCFYRFFLLLLCHSLLPNKLLVYIIVRLYSIKHLGVLFFFFHHIFGCDTSKVAILLYVHDIKVA